MRKTIRVVDTPDCVIRSVECRDDHSSWSPVEAAMGAQVVLVRRGRFRLRTSGRELTIDPTCGYRQEPGHEAQFAHPVGGDVCTSIILRQPGLTEGIGAVSDAAIRVDARLEHAHRSLLRSPRDPGSDEIESVVTLLQLAARAEPGDLPAPGRRRLAEDARDAIVSGEPASDSLVTLAQSLRASPSHLSRTFRHHVGMSVSRFRNRVRVSRALQRLHDGEQDLALLAVGLGFSDQAHLTRTLQRELGSTPGQVRRGLADTARC